MLLLASDPVELYASGDADGHGWALPGSSALWSGTGNLQPVPGRSDSLAETAGGHGPYDPAHGLAAQLMLPPDAPAADGCVALVRGEPYALSQVRRLTDPRGTGELDCLVATATGTSEWPA